MMSPIGLNPALQAYRTAAAATGLGGGAAGGLGGVTATPAALPTQATGGVAEGFEAVLGRVVENTVQSARSADATTQAALVGQAGTTDVVMAVARAELALQTAVAVRDRMVSAYQDIMRMGI